MNAIALDNLKAIGAQIAALRQRRYIGHRQGKPVRIRSRSLL